MNLAPSSTQSRSLEKNSVANFPFLKLTDEPFNTHRIGLANDSYVIADIPDYDFYILAGISSNELFSKLVVLNLNIPFGCGFDGSIEQLPANFPADRLKIIQKDVSIPMPAIRQNTTNLKYFVMNYHDIFLKMDIRGNEYLWFLSLSQEELLHFKQIVVTFYQVNTNPTKNRAMNKMNCFTKLFETHHVIHVDIKEEDNITVTYFRKDVDDSNYDYDGQQDHEHHHEHQDEDCEHHEHYEDHEQHEQEENMTITVSEGMSSLDMLRSASLEEEPLIIELDKGPM